MDEASSSWQQLGEDIDGEVAYDNSGYSVSLSADGRTVAIGSISNNDNGEESGHVRVFNQVAMSEDPSSKTTVPSTTTSPTTFTTTRTTVS